MDTIDDVFNYLAGIVRAREDCTVSREGHTLILEVTTKGGISAFGFKNILSNVVKVYCETKGIHKPKITFHEV